MRPDRPHAPTIGVFDREQWPEPFTCDFIFVTEDLAGRVGEVRVNGDTDASEHQPVVLFPATRQRGSSGSGGSERR